MTVRGRELQRTETPSLPKVVAARLAWTGPFGKDFGIVVGVILVYFVLRGQAPGNDVFAVHVAWDLVRLERWMHIFWEPTVQEWSIHYHWTQEVANFVYAYLHFPVLIVVGAWLWFVGRERFTFMRNTMFISLVIGLCFYYLLPAAPPRLLAAHGHDLGFVDTVFGGNTAVTYAQPSLILNNYAAIPSFHFGWIVMASAAVWVNTESRTLRSIAVVLSVVMGWAIVASANHFFFDMALGVLVVAISWWLARRLADNRPRLAAL